MPLIMIKLFGRRAAKLRDLTWVLFIFIVLSGCATVVPSYDIPTGVDGAPSVATIVDEIACELSRLVDGSYPNQTYLIEQDIDVAAQLNLTVNDTGSLAPTLSYISGPSFMLNGSALFSSSREQNFTEKLYFSMRDLAHDVRRNNGTRADPRRCPSVNTNLSGDLGLRDMVDMAITSRYLNNSIKLSGTDGAFGGYIKFVIMKNANMVGPLWTLKHFKGPGNLAGVSEVNTDQLTVAFARGQNHGTPFRPEGVEPSKTAAKAEALLNSIILNQISTQISNIRP